MVEETARCGAAIAMWWDIAPEWQARFEDWHSHEHLPERLAIPGFRRGSRWESVQAAGSFFVLYELDSYATLSSPRYLERLNSPSAWSTQLMPHHRNMVRSQCRVLSSFGGGVARHVLTLRLSPKLAGMERLRAFLCEQAKRTASIAGITAVHLLCTDAPDLGSTTEQQIRGGLDRSADWIVVAGGYELAALERLRAGEMSDATLSREGAAAGVEAGQYRLAHAWSRDDPA